MLGIVERACTDVVAHAVALSAWRPWIYRIDLTDHVILGENPSKYYHVVNNSASLCQNERP